MATGFGDNPTVRHIHCNDCGADFKDYPWVPGMPCPTCHSTCFEPVVAVGAPSDYAAADRSKGFALEDIRFGRLAQWAEMVSAKQVQRALFKQSHLAQHDSSVPDLAQILLKDKTLTRRQVEAIHAARRVEPGNTDDIEFGLMAVRTGLATEDNIRECRKLQKQAASDGSDVPPLPLLLCEKRYLKQGPALALLKSAEQKNKGILHAIHRAARKEKKYDEAPGPVRQLLAMPAVRAGLAVAAVIVLLLVWHFSFGASEPRRTLVKCAFCSAETAAPVSSKWPMTCPSCKKHQMYPVAICLQCGKRFILKDPTGYGTCCPHCKSAKFMMLTNDINEEELRTRIEAGEPMAEE